MSGAVPPLSTHLHDERIDNCTSPLTAAFVLLTEESASSTHERRGCISASITAGSKPRPEEQQCLIQA